MNAEELKIKQEHFRNIVAIAHADGVLGKEELQLLRERASELGLSSEELDHLLGHHKDLEFLIPMNSVDREEQLTDAIYMMMVDGSVSEQEYQLCLKIGEKLEFKPKDVDHIIDLVKELWALQQKDSEGGDQESAVN